MDWKYRRKLSYLINDFNDTGLDYTVKKYGSDEELVNEIVDFFISGSKLIYPAKSYFVAIVYAKLLEEHFNENFYDCLNYKELLPDDYFFVPYNRNRNVYNAVLSKIGDPLEYKAAEKTKEYFYQEFLLYGTDNKDNGSV